MIVWAHNGHIFNAYYKADWTAISVEPQPGGMTPTGALLKAALGDEVYAVGFTAHGGRFGQVGLPNWQSPHADGAWPIEEAPENSLASTLHTVGESYLFVDFRRVRAQPSHWLAQPMPLSLRGYNRHEVLDWTQVVDGLFFIDVMTPSHSTGH